VADEEAFAGARRLARKALEIFKRLHARIW
jgi:hypothetical protein